LRYRCSTAMGRVLNDVLIELVEELTKSGNVPTVIYEAPTGYGKTTSSVNFYSVMSRYGTASSLIHVLPMRSIAVELYCKIVNALGRGGVGTYCNDFGSDEIIEKALTGLNILPTDVGYQFMDLIDPSKSPFFLKPILITTFNSFFHNLARLPVGEFRKYRRHYEIPRTAIFTSSVVLDEAHLYGGDPGVGSEESVITAFIVSVKALAEARVPLLIESATLPTQLLNTLRKVIADSGSTPTAISFRYGEQCGRSLSRSCSDVIECHDDDYVSHCLGVRWVTKVISSEEVIKVVMDHVSRGERVLVVRNTVEKAVNTYIKLKEVLDNVALIHGRFTKIDRIRKLQLLKHAKVVVATQVVEAGVNLSLDVLVTDAASPSSIVQRAGRVARDCRVGDAYIYIVKSGGDGVYDDNIVSEFVGRVVGITKDSEHGIEWRIPSKGLVGGRVSFLRIMDEVYAGSELLLDVGRYSVLTEVITKPLITQRELNRVVSRYGSLLYNSMLVPVYVGSEIPSSMEEVLDNSVPLSLSYVGRDALGILRKRDGSLSTLALKCTNDLSECNIIEYGVGVDVLKDPLRLFKYVAVGEDHIVSLLAFIAGPGAYSYEIGLRV